MQTNGDYLENYYYDDIFSLIAIICVKTAIFLKKIGAKIFFTKIITSAPVRPRSKSVTITIENAIRVTRLAYFLPIEPLFTETNITDKYISTYIFWGYSSLQFFYIFAKYKLGFILGHFSRKHRVTLS
jgi:hypothetical protein